MKLLLKKILVAVLGSQVIRLRKKHSFKIIGIVGSIGKTSTKLAIAKILESEKRVRYQEGNYNDIVSVPLIFFGQNMPSLWNVFGWLKIIFQNEIQIYTSYPFDVVVVELGTDAPGQINQFRRYLHLDMAVVTAVAPEHMEFFRSIEEVAEEEWSVRFFSDKVFANRELCKILPPDFNHNQITFYGSADPDYQYDNFSKAQIYSAGAAVAIARFFKISEDKIKKAVKEIKNFSGRMQKLEGIKNSTIIDDTYNASPDAVRMALDALYAYPATQKIAILGMMNELGGTSETEHKKAGKYCNPEFLDLVVTVGKDANLFLAPTAKENGCEVYQAKNSIEAGIFVRDKIKKGAVILAKGSQNGVFTEEALKPLLRDRSDISKLVRQDRYWMNKKSLTFGQDHLQ